MISKLTRCFISLELPDEIKNLALRTQDEIRKRNLVNARYPSKESFHLTLKFLGEIDDETINEVKKRLKKINFHKFSVSLESTGAFNQEGETKIIWHAVGGEELQKLHKTIDSTLKDLFVPEKRFMAHITIARVKEDLNKEDLEHYFRQIKSSSKKYAVEKFALFKSVQSKDGSEYELLEEYALYE